MVDEGSDRVAAERGMMRVWFQMGLRVVARWAAVACLRAGSTHARTEVRPRRRTSLRPCAEKMISCSLAPASSSAISRKYSSSDGDGRSGSWRFNVSLLCKRNSLVGYYV